MSGKQRCEFFVVIGRLGNPPFVHKPVEIHHVAVDIAEALVGHQRVRAWDSE